MVSAPGIYGGNEQEQQVDAERERRQKQQTLELSAVAIRLARDALADRYLVRCRGRRDGRQHEHGRD